MHLSLVDRHDLAECWMDVRPWIVRACEDEGGSYLPGDILQAIARDEMQLWVVLDEGAIKACAVTEIRRHPRRATFWVLMMLGDGLADWGEFRHDVAEWARAHGCSGKRAMKSLARRGYVKLFKEFNCTHVLLERDL